MPAALNSRPLRWVATLYGIGSTLDWALTMALMVYVYDLTASPLAAAGMLVCAQVLPAFVVATVGEFADGWSVRRALSVAFLLHAASVLLLAVLNLPIYIAAFVIGAIGAVVRSQLRGGLARVVPTEHFRAGNALLNNIRGITSLFGPAAAAAALAAYGADVTLLAVAAALFAAGLLALRMPDAEPGREAIVEEEAPMRIASGAERPGLSLSALLVLAGVTICAVSVDEPVLLAYAQDDLGAGVGGYGALLAAWGVGMLIGTAIFAKLLTRSMLRVFVAALAVTGVSHVVIAVAPSITVAFIGAVIGGIASGMDWAALTTAVMERAPLGRESWAASRLEAVSTAAPALGFLVGGALALEVAARYVLAIPAVTSALIVLFFVVRHVADGRPMLPFATYSSKTTAGGA